MPSHPKPPAPDAAMLEAVKRARRVHTFAKAVGAVVSLAIQAALFTAAGYVALEFHAGMTHAQALEDCQASAAQLVHVPDRVALIVAHPACGHVVNIVRSN